LVFHVKTMGTPSGTDRARAYRIRSLIRQGGTPTDDDAEFLREYEGKQEQDRGASATSRKVSFDLEENAMAVGTGAAAEVAAGMAAGAVARQEGLRLDYVTQAGIGALVKACELHEKMASSLLERTMQLEEVHLSMLDAVREQYLARTQAEIDAMGIAPKDEDSAFNEMIATVAKPLLEGLAKK
jgi:hypothetical protein